MRKRQPELPPPPAADVPGARDSTRLLFDAVLTLLQLGTAEAAQFVAALPQAVAIGLYRVPAMALTWLSFGAFVACAVYALTQQAVWAAGSFFALQAGMMLLLQARHRALRARMQFRETRRGLAALQASLAERCGSD